MKTIWLYLAEDPVVIDLSTHTGHRAIGFVWKLPRNSYHRLNTTAVRAVGLCVRCCLQPGNALLQWVLRNTETDFYSILLLICGVFMNVYG